MSSNVSASAEQVSAHMLTDADQITGPLFPAGHRRPEGYITKPDGIFLVAPRTDRDGNPVGEKLTRVSYRPLAVVGMCHCAEGDQWFNLRWHDGLKSVTLRVDGSCLRSGRPWCASWATPASRCSRPTPGRLSATRPPT
jgi:hypothetical protein